jgi:hypothetical protein
VAPDPSSQQPAEEPAERQPAPERPAPKRANRRPRGPGGQGAPPLPPAKPLILNRVPLNNTTSPPPVVPPPGTAFIYIDAENNYLNQAVLPRQGFTLRARTRYLWRIDVDTSLRQDEMWESVPCQTSAARFEVHIRIEWSVTDPVRVVRRNLEDGRQIVFSRVSEAAQELGWRHSIDQPGVLAIKLKERLVSRQREYDEGITVHRCTVRVDVDAYSQGKAVRLSEAQFKQRIEDNELTDLRSKIKDESDLFLLYLARDRDRVGDLINDMRKNEEIKNERVLALFQQALDKGIMQSAEINEMLQRLLGPLHGVLHPTPHTDILGTQNLRPPEAAGTPQLVVPGVVSAKPEEEQEDVTPQQVREDGVDTWSEVPWDS